MQPTPAFELLHGFLPSAPPARPYGYKAPHANRGTPPRLRLGKTQRYVFHKGLDQMIPTRRPFKGHRP